MKIEQLTYTSCPAAKGADGTNGFQVRALSAGITQQMRDTVLERCRRYRPPQSALEAQQSLGKAEGLTPEVMAKFPTLVMYYELADDVFGLTRSCYVGRDYSGRFGNFFSHTLVLPAEALGPVQYNPLALTRTAIFKSQDDDSGTSLPTLDDLSGLGAQADDSWAQTLSEHPYAGHLADLFSATSKVPAARIPIVVCMDQLAMAAPLVETMLLLLPPEERCRTTFCTYEREPTRVLGHGGPSGDRPPVFRILVTPTREEGSSFEHLSEQYESLFVVFNFADDRFSPLEAATSAHHAVNLLGSGGLDGLAPFHQLLADLEVARQPDKWDLLVPWARWQAAPGLADDVEAVQAGLAGLATAVESPPQAAAAAELVWPHVEQSAPSGGQAFKLTAKAYVGFLDLMTPEAVADTCRRPEGIALFRDLLRQGRARQAAALLPSGGSAPQEVAARALSELAEQGWPEAELRGIGEADREALVDLLALGARGLQAEQAPTASLTSALVAACRGADMAGCMADLWPQIRGLVLEDLLTRDPTEEAQDAADELLAVIPEDSCPEGALAVGLWRVRSAPPDSKERRAGSLAILARQAATVADSEQATADCLGLAREVAGDGELRAILEAMLEVLGASASATHPYYRAYRETIRSPEQAPWPRREAAAERGARIVLAIEFAEVALSEDDAVAAERRKWLREFFRQREQVLPAVGAVVAARIRHGRHRAQALTLAENLLREVRSRPSEAANALTDQLLQAVVALPLSQVGPKWYPWLRTANPERWDEGRAGRLRLLLLMGEMATDIEGGMRPADLISKFDAWPRMVAELDPRDWSAAVGWFVKGAGRNLANIPEGREDAKEICQLSLGQEGGAGVELLARSLAEQVGGLDLVRQVLLLAPFASLGASDRRLSSALAQVTAQVLAEAPQAVGKALWQFLAPAPGAGPADWSRQLSEFRRLVEDRAPATAPTDIGGVIGRFFGKRR